MRVSDIFAESVFRRVDSRDGEMGTFEGKDVRTWK